MSDRNPYEQLGVTQDASFDDIQEAKARLIEQHKGDQKLLESIEAAYDAILMDRLKMRQSGKIPVPERIRFPEKLSQPQPSFTPPAINRTARWLQGLLDTPSRSDILWSSGVFLVLGGLICYPGFAQTTLSTAIAFGVGFSFFFLNRKERRFGRAVLMTLIGLFVGIGLGTLVAGSLPSLLPNIYLTPEKIISLVTFFILWLITTFLR